MLSHPLLRLLAFAVVPALIVYVFVLGFSVAAGIEPHLVVRDLMQICNHPIGVGMISNLGFLLWAGTAAISLFASLSGLVRKQKLRLLLFVGGLFSTVLCLDDLFLLHDRHVLANEHTYYLIYVIFSALFFLYFRKLIFQIDTLAFFAAVLFLGLSVLTDRFQGALPSDYSTVQLFEEGFKFVGIACWFAFWWQASLKGSKPQSSD